MTDELKKHLLEDDIFPGNCSDCLYSFCDGDHDFVCTNPESDQYGTYSSGCKLYEED